MIIATSITKGLEMILGYELWWKMCHLHRNKIPARKNFYNQHTHHFISSKIKKQTSMYRSHCFSLKTNFIVHFKFMQFMTLCQRVLRNFKLDTSNATGKDLKTDFYTYYKNIIFKKFSNIFGCSLLPLFFFPKHFTHFHQLI